MYVNLCYLYFLKLTNFFSSEMKVGFTLNSKTPASSV